MLELKRVSKFYSGNGVVTSGFSKVSLDFKMGEFVAITGESGSGKSTLLNVISGLDSYEEGEMYIAGQPTSGYDNADMEDYRKRYIGNIFQTFNLINNYTVYQNVEMVLLLSGYKRGEVKARVNEIIEKVGLKEFRRTKASKLSGGQKQRVAIARALAKETPIIVADEPTGNLDVESAAGIIKLLAGLSEEKLIIIVTHNYEQVEPYVTRKITMHDGRVVEDKSFARTRSGDGNGEASAAGAVGEESASTEGAAIEEKSESATETKPESEAAEIAAPEAKLPEEAKHDGMSFGNTLRLGIRNTFSLPAKFLLLFFVFLFLCVGTFSSYSTFQSMRSGSASELVYSEIFKNTSNKRLLITKQGREAFTEEDYTRLAAITNVELIEKKDLMLDTTFDVRKYDLFYNDVELDYWITTKVTNVERYGDLLVEGRLPGNEYEAVLFCFPNDSYMNGILEEIIDSEGYISSNSGTVSMSDMGIDESITIVGYGYLGDEELSERVSSYTYYEGFLGLTEEGMSRVENLASAGFFRLEGYANKSAFTMGGQGGHSLIASTLVEPGHVIIPDDIGAMYDWGSYYGKEISFASFSKDDANAITCTIDSAYGMHNYQWLFGVSSWDDVKQGIHMNEADIRALYKTEGDYQASVMVKDPLHVQESIDALENAGYEVLYIHKAATVDNAVLRAFLNMFRTVVLAVLLTVLFFISYFIIKLIFKSRNVYFSTVRMLGGSKRSCSGMLYVEMLAVFHLAFAISAGFLIAVKNGVFAGATGAFGKFVEYMNSLIFYVENKDFIILYVVILILTLLLALRYSGQMFKQTAMNAYKEEA